MTIFETTIDGIRVTISKSLLDKYNVNAPRYTSYPTAPVWKNNFTAADYNESLKEYATAKSKYGDLSLYFHIPFCERRCDFCGCSTIATNRRDIADKYVDAINKEASVVADLLGDNKNVVQLHLGGGTPTFLSTSQLEKMLKKIRFLFNFRKDAEIGIEVNPATTTKNHLRLLKDYNFNRISLGIQDFSRDIQALIGRFHDPKDIQQLIEFIRQIGIGSVNIDLVYGLPLQTTESFKKTLTEIVKLSPDRIACFNFAYLPKMLPHQKRIDPTKLPTPDEKFRIFITAIEFLCKNGYKFIGMDHFAKDSDDLALAVKNKTLWRNFQGYTTKSGTELIGFGLTSISDFCGRYAQNTKKLIDYFRQTNSGNLLTVKGWNLTDEDKKRRIIIRNLFCHGTADLKEIKKPDLTSFINDGFVKMDDSDINITPLGRLFVRNIASAFDEYLDPRNIFSKAI